MSPGNAVTRSRESTAVMFEFVTFLKYLIEERRRLADDLISVLIRHEAEGKHIKCPQRR